MNFNSRLDLRRAMVVKEKGRLVSKTGTSNIKYKTIIGSNPFTIDSAFLRGFMSSFLISGELFLSFSNILVRSSL